MQTICTTNRSGYEHSLQLGQSYEVVDIQDGIFAGDYYVKVDIGGGKTASALLYRFDIPKEVAEAYVQEKYPNDRHRDLGR